MARFLLSERAKAELVAIYDDSEAHFGSYQADAYLAGLERTFGLLADFPPSDRRRILSEPDSDAFGFRRISSFTPRTATAF